MSKTKVSYRFEDGLLERVRARALEERRSESQMVVLLVERGLDGVADLLLAEAVAGRAGDSAQRSGEVYEGSTPSAAPARPSTACSRRHLHSALTCPECGFSLVADRKPFRPDFKGSK